MAKLRLTAIGRCLIEAFVKILAKTLPFFFLSLSNVFHELLTIDRELAQINKAVVIQAMLIPYNFNNHHLLIPK